MTKKKLLLYTRYFIQVGFIKDVKVIIDVFKKSFKMLQYGGFLTEIEESLVFANIEEVYKVNLLFWSKLKQVVDQARQTRQPVEPSHLSPAFDNFENMFQPYIEFCNAGTPFPIYKAPFFLFLLVISLTYTSQFLNTVNWVSRTGTPCIDPAYITFSRLLLESLIQLE